MGRKLGKFEETPRYSQYSKSKSSLELNEDGFSTPIPLEDQEPLLLPETTPQIPPLKWWQVSRPYFIVLVTVVDFVMMITALVLNKGFEPFSKNPLFGPSPEILQQLGAKDVDDIQNGEWWRFLSPIFLHVGLIHLGVNVWFQIGGCMAIERSIGTIRTMAVYLISGIAGNLSSAIFLPHLLSVGASGALFGMMGLCLVSVVKNWDGLNKPWKTLILIIVTVLINLTIGLLPLVDNFCHVGGFFTGIFMALFLLPVVEKVKTEALLETEMRVRYCTIKNLIAVAIGLVLFVGIFVAGFYVFYQHISSSSWCAWCSNLSCIHWADWCKQFDPADT